MNTPASLLALAALGIGCKPAEIDEPVDEPTPYVYDEEDPPDTQVDLAKLGGSLQDTIDQLLGLNAQPALAAYRLASAQQTATCPRTYAMDGNVYWFDQCTTEGGTSFSGYGFYYDYYDFPIGGEWTGHYEILSGANQIVMADGATLDVAGQAASIAAVHNTQPALLWQTDVRGTFAWDGAGSEGTWLASGAAPDMNITVYELTETGGRAVIIDGGVSGLDGEATALVFDNVTVINGLLGSACPEEAAGAVSVRTPDGDWIDLIFDGPTFDDLPGSRETCDGKGRAFYRGEQLGEVSADFSGLLEYVEAPW
jgi:hypothetical protein